MSASKILEKLQRKGQVTPVAQQQNIKSSQNAVQNLLKSRSSSIASLVTPPGERVVDPVVARLKAARKAEKEQKERELREKKGLGPKKEPTSRAKSSARAVNGSSKQPVRGSGTKLGENRMSNGGRNRAVLPTTSAPQLQREKKPKMSFSELMTKASGIDQSKMSIAIKQKTRSPEAVLPGPKRKVTGQDPRNVLAARKPVTQSSTQRQTLPQPRNRPAPSSSAAKQQNSVLRPSQPAVQARAPLPMRKPSSALAAKLKQKPSARTTHSGTRTRRENSDENSEEEDEESDDMDSFIASEDEEIEQDEPEYDRDEIWSIFNRGKKRRHFDYDDYDSDDMEATGAEILEEESRSKRNALLEDKREMEKEAKLAALKKARKAGLRR